MANFYVETLKLRTVKTLKNRRKKFQHSGRCGTQLPLTIIFLIYINAVRTSKSVKI